MNTSKMWRIGMTFVIAAALLVSVSKVQAYEAPNILVGQDLTVGSTGPSVVVLQALLSELGYLNVPMGIPLGYYGSLTRNAVASYQASLNVSPTAGYYGPLTKISMRSSFATRGFLSILGW